MRGKLSSRCRAAIQGCLCVLLFAATLQAQQVDLRKVPVFYTLPGTEKVTVQRDVVFKTVEGAEPLKMDVYYPPGAQTGAARLPTVIFINGVGAPDLKDWQVYVDWAKLTAATGMIAIAHQARQTEALTDASDLINHVRSNAANLKVDADRIGIWSCSANVRVGLPLVMQSNRSYIRMAVFYYGIMEMQQLMRYDVPLLVARAGQDLPNLNGSIDAFVARGVAEDVPLTLINYAEGQHAFDILDDNAQTREIIRQTLDFMKFHLTKTETSVQRRAPSPGRFMAMVNNDGITKAMQALEEARKLDPRAVIFRENVLNGIGYQLLQDNRPREAVEVFKLNVAAYPQSANVYDSLGDAYEASGNKELAIQLAEKTLELLEKDTTLNEAAKANIRDSATGKLQRLKGQK